MLSRLVFGALATLLSSQVILAKGMGEKVYPNVKFGLYGRFDLRLANSDVEQANDAHKNMFFQAKSILVNFMGDVNEDTKYRFRAKFTNGWGERDIDGSSKAVQFAWVQRRVNDMLDVRLGKVDVAACGRAGAAPFSNVYIYSDTCKAVGTKEVGFQLMPKVAGQDVVITLANGGGEANQNTPKLNLTWYGKFAEGMIKPIFTYQSLPYEKQEATTDTDGNAVAEQVAATNTHMTIGTRVEFGTAFVEFDYAMNTTGSRVDGGDDTTSNAMILAANYKTGIWNPHLKFFQETIDDKVTTNTTGDNGYKKTGFALALEVYPDMLKGDKSWRAHIAYTSATKTPDDSSQDSQTDTQIIIGTKFVFTKA